MRPIGVSVGHHSARIALCSIDYHAIGGCYLRDWSEISVLMLFRPDCWMIANDTLRKIYDTITERITPVPTMFHAIRARSSGAAMPCVRRFLAGSKSAPA